MTTSGDNQIPAIEICKGDVFVYRGETYTALEDPTGYDRIKVAVNLYLPNSATVTVHDTEEEA